MFLVCGSGSCLCLCFVVVFRRFSRVKQGLDSMMPGHSPRWCWRWKHGVTLPRHPFPLQWSCPPHRSTTPLPRLEAEKKNTQRATRRGAAAGANTAESLEPLLACRPLLAGQPVHWAARSGHFHSMPWKWKWHFCNLHHVTSVNALPLDRLPPSSPQVAHGPWESRLRWTGKPSTNLDGRLLLLHAVCHRQPSTPPSSLLGPRHSTLAAEPT